MKKLLAVSAALLLIVAGCDFKPGQYPRAQSAQPVAVAPVSLGITIPNDADEAVEGAVLTLQAKLIELSGGSIELEVYRAGDVFNAMQQEETGLYLLNSSQVKQLDNRLKFIQMPFLSESSEQMLAMLNSENGAVRSSPVTRNRLGGEVIGVYYGGTTWFIGKAKFYDEVGFYNSVGVRSDWEGNTCFGVLGAGTVAEGSREELFSLFAEGKIKYCELRPADDIPEEVMSMAKNIEVTNHRFDSRWLILRDNGNMLEPVVRSMIKEAFSYTVMQHDTIVREQEIERQARLLEQTRLAIAEDAAYSQTRMLARKYYRENWEALGIPKEIWDELQLVRGY